MKNHSILLAGIAALAAAVALVAGLGTAAGASRNGVTVAGVKTGLGRTLVDGRGRTLYLFGKDKHGNSACSGACAGYWPPLFASGKPHAASGAKASLLGTTKRADGRLQVTYNHHPVYTFVQDTHKGDTRGEGLNIFGGEW